MNLPGTGALQLLDGKTYQSLGPAFAVEGATMTNSDNSWDYAGYQFSTDGKQLALVTYVGIWETIIGSPRWLRTNREERTAQMSIRVLDTNRAILIKPELRLPISDEESRPFVVWSRNSNKLAVILADTAIVYDTGTGGLQRYDCDKQKTLLTGCFSPDSKFLYIFCENGVLKWNLAENEPAKLITGDASLGALSPDGKVIATAAGSMGGSFELWNSEDGKAMCAPIIAWSGIKSEIGGLAFSSDSERLLVTTWQTGFRIWNVKTLLPLTENIQSNPLFGGQFIANDDLIITTSKWGIDFWSSDAKHLAGRVETSGMHPGVRLSADKDSLIFIDQEEHLSAKPVPGQLCDAPQWLAELAEATCGWRINDAGVLESIEDSQPEKVQQVYLKIRSSSDGSPLKDWAMTYVVP